MTEVLVGAGGWAYFQVPEMNSLQAYGQAFNFVEANRTYYRIPTLSQLVKWRKLVYPSFEFALRYPREFVEENKLEMNSNTRRLANRVKEACIQLRATILTILIPQRIHLPVDELEDRLEHFLNEFVIENTILAIEFRDMTPPNEVFKIMSNHEVVHAIDLSREEPTHNSPIMYSRLFGKGEKNIYEFDDNELKEIARKASEAKVEKSILAFHGVRMYRDTARMKKYLDSGIFPKLSDMVGLESIEKVLREDTIFPITKSDLVRRQGWKLFNVTSFETKRMREILEPLPTKVYSNLDQVISSLRDNIHLIS